MDHSATRTFKETVSEIAEFRKVAALPLVNVATRKNWPDLEDDESPGWLTDATITVDVDANHPKVSEPLQPPPCGTQNSVEHDAGKNINKSVEYDVRSSGNVSGSLAPSQLNPQARDLVPISIDSGCKDSNDSKATGHT